MPEVFQKIFTNEKILPRNVCLQKLRSRTFKKLNFANLLQVCRFDISNSTFTVGNIIMATNEDLDQKFGALFCSLFSHDFVRKHLRLAETEPVLDLGESTTQPVLAEQQVEKTNECASKAEKASISTAGCASVQDESFKTAKSAVSEAESFVGSDENESTDVTQSNPLTTFIQCVEPQKSTNSGEQSDESSAADKSDYDADTDTPMKSSKAAASNASLIDGVRVSGRSKYLLRSQSKKSSDDDSYLKEVKELKLNHHKQKSPNEPNLVRKKVKLRQQKNFSGLSDDDDTDFEMLGEKADVVNHQSNNQLFNKAKKGYELEEDHNILKFITHTNRQAEIKGNKLWKDMEEKKFKYSRPWQSLKERFKKTIAPKLLIYTEMFPDLNQEAMDTLLNHIEKSSLKN